MAHYCQIQGQASVLQTDVRHIIGGKAVNGAHEHRQQGDILHGVIHHPQKGQHQGHFCRRKKTSHRGCPRWDAALGHFLGIEGRHLIGTAQKHTEIPVLGRALGAVFGDQKAPLHHLPNHTGNVAAFQNGGLLLFVAQRTVQYIQPGRAAGLNRVNGPGGKALGAGILHIADFGGHNLPKYEVDGICYLLPGAEVFIQHHAGRMVLLFPVVGSELLPVPQENAGHGLPEAINALLYVAHHKAVLPVLGKSLEQQVLGLVGVLVFIHHNLVKAFGKGNRVLGGPESPLWVFLCQQADGPMLQIAKIGGFALQFLFVQPFGKSQNTFKQLFHQRGHADKVLPAILPGEDKAPRQLFQRLLGIVPGGGDPHL